jgi:hypothetical protein
MFNFKNLSGLSQLMMSANTLPDRIKEMRQQLAQTDASGSAAEGAVKVMVNGLGVVLRIEICQSLISCGTTSQVEQLLPQALNEALTKVRKMHIDKMRELTGGVDLPGLDEALGGL